jgi:YfiR/HmsC-like
MIVGLLLLILVGMNPLYLFSQIDEMELKLVFIERFTHFIDWNISQSNSSEELDKNFIIGTIGSNEHNLLSDFFSGREIKGKPVKIVTVLEEEEYLNCNLLFISEIEEVKLLKILKTVANSQVLTISDRKEHCQSGILITICRQGDHLEFCINETALAVSGLKANYLLLESAKIINPLVKGRP